VLLWGAVFVVAVAFLVMSAGWFTEGAEELGIHLGVPSYLVGVTIVAIGTSLPELVSSVIAVLRGSPEIVMGNVVGSNIANIFLVLGFAAIIGRTLTVTYEIIHVDLPTLVASAFFVAVAAWDGIVSRGEGVILIAGAVVYMAYAVNIAKQRGRIHEDIDESLRKELKIEKGELDPWTWPRIAGGAVVIFFAANYTVESVIELSKILKIGTEVIAVSAVAIGTSLPELAVSSVAAKRGNLEVAMGNVLGSTIFNSFIVLGIPAVIADVPAPPAILTLGLPVMIIATLLYFFMAQDREITRWEGWLLVLFYVLFLGKLFELI